MMYGKTGDEATRVIYIFVLCVAFLLSSYLFASIFIFNADTGIAIKDNSEDKPDEVLTTSETDAEVLAKIEALKKEIETYDKILDSNYMMLVNKSNPLSESFEQIALIETESNPAVKLESTTAKKIQDFINAAKEAGFTCKVITGYRTKAEQERIYNSELQSLRNAGFTSQTAESMAALTVAKPGESEFETGFTVEIAETSAMTMDEFESSELFKFIKENIHKYGFILRYPQGKESVTGYSYNPFCFRYIGDAGVSDGVLSMSHAQYIYEKNLTLEEYIDYIKNKRTSAVQSLNVLTAD